MYFQRPKTNKFLLVASISLIFLFVLIVPSLVQAQDLGADLVAESATSAGIGESSLPAILGRIFKIVLSVLGLIALVVVIIAGIQWMTSGGNSEKIKKAKALLSAGLIGLLIIVCAYAMVSFIISSLGGVTEGTGCTPGNCCGDGYAWNSDCECDDWVYPSCATGQSQEYFRLTRGEANFDIDNKIYLCSNIRAVFNHNINENTVNVAVANSTLKVIDSDDIIISGTFQTTGGSILFTPENFWTEFSDYKLIIPKTISDNNNKYLVGCAMGFSPAGGCSNNGTVDWDFTTNNEEDITPPFVDHAYPIMDIDDPLYPDKNVSRAPMIDVVFNENIDYATIVDTNHADYNANDSNTWHPIVNNFQLCEIEAQNTECNPVNIYNNDNFIIVPISQGFRIFITNAQWLDAFTWYEIQVDGVYDMCNNQMADSQSWEFQTNNNIPGAQDWWPKGSNVCPDALVGIRFATSMYEYEVKMSVVNDDGTTEFEGLIKPSDIASPGPYETTLTTGSGSLKVVDDDYINVSNQFKIFQLELNDTLNIDTPYTIEVTTDLVIDVDGNTLDKSWSFDVTNMQDCACEPIIYEVLPSSGARQSCVTIRGHCFAGTTERPATINELWFDDTQDPPPPNGQQFIDGSLRADIEGHTANSIVTIIPENFGDPLIDPNTSDIPDFLGVGIKIIYDDNQEEVENFSESQFTVIDNALAQGPCIWRLDPNNGYVGDRFNVEGIKFGLTPGVINIEDWFFNLTYSGAWNENLIEQVMVPGFTTAGDRDVTVVDGSGFVSNPVPFDVIFDRPEVKEFGCNPPPVYSSPSPYKNTEDACVAIDLILEFTKDMIDFGPDGVLNINNYTIQNCGTDDIYNEAYCSQIYYNPSNAQFDDLNSSRIVRLSLSSAFTVGTWYTINVLANVKSDEDVGMEENYVWHFKTRDTDVCPVASINLTPQNETITGCSGAKAFEAEPYASNCNALTPGSYSYDWSSSNPAAATIGTGNTYQNIASAAGAGSTWIRVEEADSFKWTKELLNVNCCRTNEDCYDPDGDGSDRCLGSECNDDYGICTPVINDFNPESGYYNDWVSIHGCWFNNYNASYSRVRFNEELSIIPFDKCTSSAWQNEQIIAEVPETGNPFGYIQVTSAPYGSAFVVSSSDIFNDYGSPRAGICNLRPSHGIPGSITQLTANDNLLGQGGNDDVYYGTEKAISYPPPGWVFQEGIRSQSSFLLPIAPLNVKVLQDNIDSNTLNFNVDPIGGGPEDLCIEGCGVSCDTGFIYCSSPYLCLEETLYGCSDCRCCCEITNPPNPYACGNGLDCFVGQGDCTGSERGLCCGCDDDSQCAPAGCGFLDPNRCCYGRPAVGLGTCDASGGTGAGLNTAFTLTFDRQMDRSRLNDEYIKVSKEGTSCGDDDGEYINGRCYLNGQIVSTNSADNNITVFYPNDCKLTRNTIYTTEFIVGDDGDGVRSSQGVSYGSIDNACTWDSTLNCAPLSITTAISFCVIDKINVEPRNFTIKGQGERDYLALALDDDNNTVCVPNFTWWSSIETIATVSPRISLDTTATTATPVVYGETVIKATVEGQSCSTADPYTCGKLKVSPTDLPRVIEQQGCEICSADGQSPSPYRDSEENCPNAQIVARFNRLIEHSTLNSTNIILEVFDDGNQAYVVFPYISLSITDSEGSTIIFVDSALNASKKYRVTLKSGLEENSVGIKDTNGLPLDGNKNDVQDGSPDDDYIWEFETGSTNCPLNKICINPQDTIQLNHPDSQSYYTDTYASNCNYLLASNFNNNYEWTLENQEPAQAGRNVANFVPSAPPQPKNWETTVQSLNLGEADIETKIVSHPQINDSVHLIVATNPSVDSALPQGSGVCCNTIIQVGFDQIMNEDSISLDTVKLWGKYNNAQPGLNCTGGCTGFTAIKDFQYKNIFARLYYKLKNIFTKKVSAQTSNCWCELPANISTYEEDNKTIVKIDKGLLDSNREYKVVVKSGNDGVKTKYALVLSDDYEWSFTAGELCALSEVRINPEDIYFNTAGVLENLDAHTYDSQGNEIFGVTGYNWDWLWESDNSAVVNISGDITNPQTEITSQGQDGLSQITATATLNIGTTIPPVVGPSVVGQVQAQVSICEHPWIYIDLDTNFKFSYCRDKDPLLPRLLLKGEGVIPSNCGNGIYEPLQGEISCDGLDNTPAHATCLFDCSGWICDQGYYLNTAQDGCITKWPSAPSGLLAEIDETNPDSQINLNWDDNSVNEDGFIIERKFLTGTWTEINTVGINVILYNDAGLNQATTYYYRMKAFNEEEDITYYSTYCTEAIETTGCPEGECYENGLCYEDESCVTNTTQMCFEGQWINSCGDQEVNCYEVCDGLMGNIPGYNTHCQDDCMNWECDAGWGACEGSNSCQENLLTNRLHCGECNNPCGSSQICENGICVYQSLAPATPSGLTATQNSIYPATRIDLEWTDESGNEDGFKIERKDGADGFWDEIANLGVNITSYNDIGLNSNFTYYYKIMAYNDNGNSDWSNEDSAITAIMPSYAPPAPTNLSGTPDITEIELEWYDNSSGMYQEDGFDVQINDGGWVLLEALGPDSVFYTHTGLVPSTNYAYRIRAYNEDGESYSDWIVLSTNQALTSPDPPTNLEGVIDGSNPYSQINLTWDDNSNDEAGFKIERDSTQIAVVGAGVEQYQDAGLNPSTSYDYGVFAFNNAGDSGLSNVITVITATIPTAPAAPTGLSASAVSSSQINLTWTDNSNNETGFKVERPDTSVIATLGPNTQLYQHIGLNFDTAYSYRVKAYNDIGSSLSNEATATTDNCSANQCGYNGFCYDENVCHPNDDIKKCVTSNWLTSCGDSFFNCNEICDGINTPFHTVCNDTCSGWTCEANYGDCTSDSGCETDLTTTSNCGGCGIICDTNAGEVCQIGTWICIVVPPPDAPSGLTATANFDEINLTWTDNADNEDGFEIERYLDSNLDFTATVGSNVTDYPDTGLVTLTSYFYKIRAYNVGGYSSYSNTASATTTCADDQCEDDHNCYDDESCHPNNIISQCDGVTTNWISSCGFNGINCGEVCDGDDSLSHIATCNSNCNGFICENDWGDCNGIPTDGCEADLLNSWYYCGSCAIQCPEDWDCIDGECEGGGGGGS